MDQDNKHILIVEANTSLQMTLSAILEHYFDKENIYVCTNGHDALWLSGDLQPNFVLIDHTTIQEDTSELLTKLHYCIKKFQGIIIYYPDSTDHEQALINKIKCNNSLSNILTVRLDDFCENYQAPYLHTFFHSRSLLKDGGIQ